MAQLEDIRKEVVIGTGPMGLGIACALASAMCQAKVLSTFRRTQTEALARSRRLMIDRSSL